MLGRIDDKPLIVIDRLVGVFRKLHDNGPKPSGRLIDWARRAPGSVALMSFPPSWNSWTQSFLPDFLWYRDVPGVFKPLRKRLQSVRINTTPSQTGIIMPCATAIRDRAKATGCAMV
jgi:hypothetical protein